MRDPVVVDTNVFGAELGRRRRSPLVDLYRPHLLGRVLVIAGQTVAEMEFGAELAGWGAARRTRLAAVIGTAEISWPDLETARCLAKLKRRAGATGTRSPMNGAKGCIRVGSCIRRASPVPSVCHRNTLRTSPPTSMR